MKKLIAALLLLILTSPCTWPQMMPRIRMVPTHPKLPNREMLRRMDMDLRWNLVLPRFDEQRDRLWSAQVIQGDPSPQIIIQTYLGYTYLIDGEKGDVIWVAQPTTLPPSSMQQAAYNSHSIYLIRDDYLHILDRRTGSRLLYTYDPLTKLRTYYGFSLQMPKLPDGTRDPSKWPIAPPEATPVADEGMLFYTAGDRIVALRIPDYTDPFYKGGGPPLNADSERPELAWILMTGKGVVAHAPVVTTTQVGAVTTEGVFMSLSKTDQYLRFKFATNGKVVAALGVHAVYNSVRNEGAETVYIASTDQALYAVNLALGGAEPLAWRFLATRPIVRKPYVNDRDVFVKTEKGPFYRVDRANGKDMWAHKTAVQFMAANRLFVYTRDASGSLLIHDYLRGTEMAAWDFRDWHLSIPNELNDRIYLANHDGQVICLANHDYRTPQKMKSTDYPIRPPPKKQPMK